MSEAMGKVGPKSSVGDLLKKHTDWWSRKGMLYAAVPHEPLGDLWLPLADGSVATNDVDVIPEILDLERLAGPVLQPGSLEFFGDAICTRAPYVRVPWVEAVLGCPIRATIMGGSMRSDHFVRTWSDWDTRVVRRDDEWLELLKRLTAMLAANSGGRYAVTHTLMRGPSDLAEAVLGPELMCLSMYDHPHSLRRFLDEVTETFLDVLEAQREQISMIEGGYVNPFGVWAPGWIVRTQCDATAFLSPAQYQQWFLPYDEQICGQVERSIIHLHSGSLHVVDVLLQVDRPHAIQISLDPPPSGPPVESIVPTFAKILAHKPLIVDGQMTEQEVDLLRRELPHDGLYISGRLDAW